MRPDHLRRWASLFAFGLLAAGAVFAAPAWKQLTSAQQALIQPALISQGGDFDKLPEPRRAALVKGADRWLAMSSEQRTVATQQFQQWQQLSNAEKLSVLERRERFRKLSPEERKALLETQKQFLEMPLKQQQELQSEFQELAPHLEALPTQSFGAPGSPAPGTTSPLGLPLNSLPSSNAAGVTPPPLPR